MPLLRAILAGKKTVTRRPIRPSPVRIEGDVPIGIEGHRIEPIACLGERLWVREKWARLDDGTFVYAIDDAAHSVRWVSSRFMPRVAARLWLTVDEVSVARLSTIDDSDALAEGAAADLSHLHGPRAWFMEAWNAIYGEGEFASANDPWVWIIRFRLMS